MSAARNAAIIDSLQQEVEILRKLVKEQKKKRDAEMEAMQSSYDELNEQCKAVEGRWKEHAEAHARQWNSSNDSAKDNVLVKKSGT